MPAKSGTTSKRKRRPRRARIFISYKRNVDPDQALATELFEALRREHDVFIDQILGVGTLWAKEIEAELARTDFLIVLLSAESVQSEMLQGEIECAHHLAKRRPDRRPVILPVRLAYLEPYQYPLSAYLNPINWTLWEGPADTPGLLEELQSALSGKSLPVPRPPKTVNGRPGSADPLPAPLPVAQPLNLKNPDGTMDPQDAFYVERQDDAVALSAIQSQGVTLSIKAPRQMGKSSLLMRTIQEATRIGKQVAFLDFQFFDRTALGDADTFFRQFCTWLRAEVKQDTPPDTSWNPEIGIILRCTRYVERQVLEKLQQPLVLAMDEVETVFDSPFRSDFFAMLRGWHNSRFANSPWKRLDLVLVTSTEPYDFIVNRTQSPFNVGETIRLADFTPEQITDLNQRHRTPLSPTELEELIALVGGHPYLVRRALYLVASKRLSAAELFRQATEERGPFGDHLRYHLFRLHDKETLVRGLTEVLRQGRCRDEPVFAILEGAGLVRRRGSAVQYRCRLYADFFRERLDV
jgi:hypothetical protein